MSFKKLLIYILETESSHQLFSLTNVPKLRAGNSIQGPNYLSHQLLPLGVGINRGLRSELRPRHPDMDHSDIDQMPTEIFCYEGYYKKKCGIGLL